MKVIRIVSDVVLYWLSWIVPKKCDRIAFGGWMGELYSDNPRYFFEYVISLRKDLDVAWIGKEPLRKRLPKGARFITMGSWRATWFLMRSKYWFFCQWEYDMSPLPLWGRVVCVNLFHGIPLKLIGVLTPKFNADKAAAGRCGIVKWTWRWLYKKILPRPKEWTIVASEGNARIFVEGCPNYFSYERVLRIGTPRNDFLLQMNAMRRDSLREKYANLFGYLIGQRVVLYAPTFRLGGGMPFMFSTLDGVSRRELEQMLVSENAVVIEKHHFHTLEKVNPGKDSGRVYIVRPNQQESVDVQELLVVADVLVTDYSSLYVDYALQKKPCIHFAHDFEEYARKDSGLAYDLRDVGAGPIVYDLQDLFHAVRLALRDQEFSPAPKFNTLVEYEKGRACEALLRFIER